MKIVLKDLEVSGCDTDTITLWNEIEKWYSEGGPDRVEEEITSKLNEIKSIANRQIKETRQIVIKPRKKKKTRR